MKKIILITLASTPLIAFASGEPISYIIWNLLLFFASWLALFATPISLLVIIYKSIKNKKLYRGKLYYVVFVVFVLSILFLFYYASINKERWECHKRCDEAGIVCSCNYYGL